MYDNQPGPVIEARPMAIRFAKEIGNACNKKWKAGAQMAALVGSLTFQNIVVSIAIKLYPPGSAEGLKFLENFYEGSKKDAVERWNALDLKIRHQRGEI